MPHANREVKAGQETSPFQPSLLLSHGQSGSNCLQCGLWGSHISIAEDAELLFAREAVCDAQNREGSEVSECSHPGSSYQSASDNQILKLGSNSAGQTNPYTGPILVRSWGASSQRCAVPKKGYFTITVELTMK